MIVTPVLDRREPTDWIHRERYEATRFEAAEAFDVERVLNIPRQYRFHYDQGREGACVGFSESWMMSILNRKRYDARRLYQRAQAVDEWAETPPEEGTSLRAGFDVLRNEGHWRVWDDETRPVELDEGIERNEWGRTVDQIRGAIAAGIPVVFGINWYQDFSNPREVPREGRGSPRVEYYIGTSTHWGRVLGGHAIVCAAASDKRDAFGLVNSWGPHYPFLVWLPYGAMARLLRENGEAGIPVDRRV